jgi:hypothetical protein
MIARFLNRRHLIETNDPSSFAEKAVQGRKNLYAGLRQPTDKREGICR